jgi:hypothetical protein
LPYQWVDRKSILVNSRLDGPTEIDTVDNKRAPIVSRAHFPDNITRRLELIHNWSLSPDGQWLITVTSFRFQWMLARRDMTEYKPMPPPAFGDELLWGRDSRHWYRFTTIRNQHAIVRYSIELKTPPEFIPIRWDNGIQTLLARKYDPIMEIGDGRILCVKWEKTLPGHIDCLVYNIAPQSAKPNSETKRAAIPHFIKIPTPNGAELSEMEISPDGARIAWLFDFRNVKRSLYQSLFGQLTGTFGAELWVSDINGGAMHPVTIGPNPEQGPKAVRWAFDNKRVSFMYNDSLYITDAK